jgi:hypothetical protein
LGEGAFDRPPSQFRRPRPATIREVGSWIVGLALGAALAPLAAAIAFATGRRPVHAKGRTYQATVEMVGQADAALDGTVLDRPGSYPAIVRLSRGFGRRLDEKDVHGLAIRLPDAGGPGNHQDLLLATAKPGRHGRESTTTSADYGARFSSTLHLGVPTGAVLVIASPLGPVPDDALVNGGAATGLRFELSAQFRRGAQRRVAIVTLGAPLDTSAENELHFTIANDWGGIRPLGVMNDARVVVYLASEHGRRARRR